MMLSGGCSIGACRKKLPATHNSPGINIRVGTEIFLRGFVKRIPFSDTLADHVDRILADPGIYWSRTCRPMLIAYLGRIYYDLADNSEMTIGVDRISRFSLPENFRHP